MPSSAAQSISPFEGDHMSHRSRRARALVEAVPAMRRTPGEQGTADKGSFRTFLQTRHGKPAKTTAKPAAPQVPTEERLAKADRPRKTPSGFYRAPAPIERLRDRGSLDPMPNVNEAMYQAANKLQQHFYEAGLGGIGAQDLSRCVHGGDGGSAGFPKTERAMHHRQKFREACRLMGWYEVHPYKGAGRLVIDVICYEMAIKDASLIHIPGGRAETNLATGMDRLRQGLFSLAVHWKLF